MGASDYVLGLRQHIGHALLVLPGVCVIVLRDGERGREILLAQRGDDASWTPITGGTDPGEEPDQAAVRECLEETGVRIEVERVTWLETLDPVTFPNGDQCEFHDVCMVAHPIEGEARVADDENLAVRWFPVDHLPPMIERFERKIAHALSGDTRVLFGRDGR